MPPDCCREHELLRLAGGCLWHRRQQDDSLRHLEPSEVLAAVGDDVSVGRGGAGLEHDEVLHPCCPLSFGRDDRDDVACRHLCPDRDVHLRDDAVGGRDERRLHLHRLEHHQHVAPRHGRADLGVHPDDAAVHRRAQAAVAGALALGRGPEGDVAEVARDAVERAPQGPTRAPVPDRAAPSRHFDLGCSAAMERRESATRVSPMRTSYSARATGRTHALNPTPTAGRSAPGAKELLQPTSAASKPCLARRAPSRRRGRAGRQDGLVRDGRLPERTQRLGGQVRGDEAGVVRPERNASCARTCWRKAAFVVTPNAVSSRSAAASRSRAVSRSGPCAMSFACMES